jgi:hypothetical protein
MIRLCDEEDFDEIWTIINDGASAYRGIIPADRWSEPYMTREKLRHEIQDGVVFWGVDEDGSLQAVSFFAISKHSRNGRCLSAHGLTRLGRLASMRNMAFDSLQ